MPSLERQDASSGPRQIGVIILGMHRSGTSCLAGMLQGAGFFAGKVTLWDRHNRKGNREDPRINGLNELVLQISGGSWNAPPARIHWTPQAALERDGLLQAFAGSRAPWMFKDPRTLLTLPFWLDAGYMPRRLGIWRDPLSVAQSLATRNGLPIARGLELWAAYNGALIDEHDRAPFPVVCFDLPREAFIAAVRAALEALCANADSSGSIDLNRLAEFFDEELINQGTDGEKLEVTLRGLPGADASLVERVLGLRWALCRVSGYPAAPAGARPRAAASSEAVLRDLIRIEHAEARSDPDTAWRACNALLEQFPRRADLWLRLVKVARESGNTERLASSLQRGLDVLPEDPSLWLEQAKLHWKRRALDKALIAAERAAALAPEWPDPRQQLGVWAAARKRWEDVERWLGPLAQEGRSTMRGELLLGVAAIHRGGIDRGNELIEGALGKADRAERAEGLFKWGVALAAAGRAQEGCGRLLEAFAMNPAAEGVAAALASLQQDLGNSSAALKTLDTALDAGAEGAGLRLTAARIRQSSGQEPDADIAAGLRLDPAHRGLRQFAGQRAYASGRFEEALEHFLAACSGQNPGSALLGAARCHAKLGDSAAAAALLDGILGQEPDHAQALRLREELAHAASAGTSRSEPAGAGATPAARRQPAAPASVGRAAQRATKVFCIGRNKTGTTSIAQALRDAGFSVGHQPQAELLLEHWARRDFAPIIDYCRSADAFQDVPFSLDYTYQALDQAFPGARFILTIRGSAEEWFDSLVRFHIQLFRKGRLPTPDEMKRFPYRYQGWIWRAQQLIYGIGEASVYDRERYIRHYNNHTERVLEYFRFRPDDLLVLNLADPDADERLCRFLGVDSAGFQIPHLNRTNRTE